MQDMRLADGAAQDAGGKEIKRGQRETLVRTEYCSELDPICLDSTFYSYSKDSHYTAPAFHYER